MCQQIREIVSSYKLLFNSIEKPIYHYTTHSGIIGIIERKSLWATSIFYVNDDREFLIALDQFRELLFRSKEKMPVIEFAYWLRSLDNSEKILRHQHVFVCSFSENGDQLSQWRGYCPNANGYSIGFKPSFFHDLKEDQDFRLVKCEYESSIQRKILQQIFDSYLEERKSIINPQQLINKYIKGILQFVCPIFKHNSFEEEKESRLVYVPEASLTMDSLYFTAIKFRPGKSMIVPFVDFKLCAEGESINLHEIIIGPTPHRELSKYSIETLMEVNNVLCDKVTISESPYRGW